MKKIVSLFVALVLFTSLAACNKDDIVFDFDNGYITVGLEADYPPFNWLETSENDYNYPIYNTNDYVAGYDVSVAIAVAESLGLELRIKTFIWDALIPALQSGDIDLIIAGMSPRPDRLEQINFSDAYYTVQHVVVVHKDNPLASATSLEDFANKKGVGQKGTVYADLVDYVKENYNSISLPVMDTIPLITNLIVNKEADFTIVERPVALGMIAANSSLTIVLDTNENIFNVSDEDRLISIGYRKSDDNLGTKVNEALSTITSQMREAWMNDAISNSEE